MAPNPKSASDVLENDGIEMLDQSTRETKCESMMFSTQTHKPGMTRILLLTAIMGVLGNSIPTGYNIGVINTPQTILEEFCNRSMIYKGISLSKTSLEFLWSIIVSVFLIGAVIGSLCASSTANKLERRPILLLNSCVGLTSAALFAFAEVASSIELLFLGRLFVGFYSGLGSTVVPMYLAEIAPPNLRGALGVLQQLGLTLGILFSQILGQREVLGTEESWPILLSLYSIGITVALIILPFCPESPSYLYVTLNAEKRAFKELEKLRGMPISMLGDDIVLMKKEKKLNESGSTWTLMKLLKTHLYRMPLFLVCFMHGGQQLSGISAVFYYSTSTFEKAGMSVKQSQYGSIGAGIMNVVMACIAIPLVNGCRRRVLSLISIGAVTVCLIFLTVSMTLQDSIPWMCYVTIASIVLYVCVYGIGLGPLPFMIGNELFQLGPRAAGMSFGCMINWLCNFLVAMVFPTLQNFLGEYVFLIFATFCFFLGVFIYKNLPETRGLDAVEVATLFNTSPPSVSQEVNEEEDLIPV